LKATICELRRKTKKRNDLHWERNIPTGHGVNPVKKRECAQEGKGKAKGHYLVWKIRHWKTIVTLGQGETQKNGGGKKANALKYHNLEYHQARGTGGRERRVKFLRQG